MVNLDLEEFKRKMKISYIKSDNPCPSCGAILLIKNTYVRCPRRHFCGYKKDNNLYNKSLEPKN